MHSQNGDKFWREHTRHLRRAQRAISAAGSEHLPYKQRVGGSNPSSPTKPNRDGSLAQLNRASDYGSEGCRFESCRSHTQRTGKKGKDGHTRLFFLFLYTLHTTSGHQTQDVQGRIDTRFATWTGTSLYDSPRNSWITTRASDVQD